jgi:D-alanyl-D-alanine dipeptidase
MPPAAPQASMSWSNKAFGALLLNQNVKHLNRYFKSTALLACLAMPQTADAADLPAGFVRLSEVAPSIRQEMLYAGSNNFLGRPAAGYNHPACILAGKAASALAAVQAELAKDRKSLIVFDCYRPRQAVADFVAWVKQGGAIDKRWSPKTPRADLIREGYVGAKSAHSRGSTVDLAIVDLSLGAPTPSPACGYAAADMLDFGSGYDCFDPTSRVHFAGLAPEARRNRLLLIDLMDRAGFKSYSGEWWHFTLRQEPYPTRRFDFPVE